MIINTIDDVNSNDFGEATDFGSITITKERLYSFICIKNSPNRLAVIGDYAGRSKTS